MSRIEHKFSPEALHGVMTGFPAGGRLLVGFSGGADSSALLLALHELSGNLGCPLEAIHFNHGLQEASAYWEQHCRHFCLQHDIPIQVHSLSLNPGQGTSPEALARKARYGLVARILRQDEMYLTAHHADDQAETLFLNLLRGSGTRGLSGIPKLRRLNAGWVARPLLGFSRSSLEAYLSSKSVEWIVDPTNLDASLDRSFLRAVIFPQLAERWPALVENLARSSSHLLNQQNAMQEALVLSRACEPADDITLSLEGFTQCSTALQAEIIRHWIHQQYAMPPPFNKMMEFLNQLNQSKSGHHAEIRWGPWMIKHHAGQLWFQDLENFPPCPTKEWESVSVLDLGHVHGTVILDTGPDSITRNVCVVSRGKLDQVSTQASHDRKIIKEIMRLSGTPHWLRDCIPILYWEAQLAAVGDWWFSPGFRKRLIQADGSYEWRPLHPLLRKIQSDGHNSPVDPAATLV
jgi:tRNA(Ile)-lysidine synthase